MSKLIKLSDTHYIIVDDSEIKEGDWVIELLNRVIFQLKTIGNDYSNTTFKKITHSTQPLEYYGNKSLNDSVKTWLIIDPLSLSEVEESINGYSVEKLSHSWATRQTTRSTDYWRSMVSTYVEGFKSHQELVKDKLFLTDENLFDFLYFARTHSQYSDGAIVEEFKKSLLPKTEWDITINEQGKITLM